MWKRSWGANETNETILDVGRVGRHCIAIVSWRVPALCRMAAGSHIAESVDTRPMRFRKLRIAWSVVCGIVCILLIVSWVRSYGRFNQLGRKLSDSVWFGSQAMRGQLMFSYDDDPATMAALKTAGANGWVRGEILAEDWIAPPAIQNQSLFRA